METTTTETPKTTLQELAEHRAQTQAQVSRKGGDKEEVVEPTQVEVPAEDPKPEEPKEEPKVAAAAEEETLIRIGDKTFKTQSEAIRYAEKLEHEKDIAEAHTAGIQEALNVTRPQVEEKPVEDNFEEKFYSDPKGTLAEVKKSARDEALAIMKQENKREAQWTQFFNENPDLEGQRDLCEYTLYQPENWKVIGNMEADKGMKLLATKVRARFQDYDERKKPRTELSNRGGQVVSSGSHVTTRVTPHKAETPLDLVSQMKKIRSKN